MLIIGSFNANSLAKRETELHQFIIKKGIDIMCIQETWISPKSKIHSLKGYEWISTDPSHKRGSGIGIFIKKTLPYKVLKITQIESQIEFIALNLEK